MTIFFDEFTRVDSTTVGNDWTERTAAGGSIESKKCRINSSGANVFDRQIYRPTGEAWADGVYRAIGYMETSTASAALLQQWRIQSGAGYNNCYELYLSASAFSVYRADAGALTLLDTVAVTPVGNRYYEFYVWHNGGDITAWLRDTKSGLILGELQVVDSTYGSGVQALTRQTTGNDSLYDEFTALPMTDAELIVQERFDEITHWTLDTTAGTASVVSHNNSNWLQLNRTGAGVLAAKMGFTEPATAKYALEIDITAIDATAIGKVQFLSAANAVIAEVVYDNTAPNGSFDTDGATATTFTWAATTPKQIVLTVDTVANTIRAGYTVGTGGSGSSWPAVSTAKTYSGTAITQVQCISETGSGKTLFGQLRIFRTTYAAIGDSLTAGASDASSIFGDSTAPSWNPNPASTTYRQNTGVNWEHSWPALASRIIDPQQPVWIANRGVSGDTIAEMLARVATDVIDQGFTTCLIMGGTNDILQDVSLATMQSGMTSLFALLDAASVSVIVMSVPPSDDFDHGQNLKLAEWNEWLKYTCAENQRNYTFVDVYAALHGANGRLAGTYDANDGLHLSTAGLYRIALAVSGAYPYTPVISDQEIAAVKADTAAILLDTGTDGVVVAAASKTGYSLAATGLDAIVSTATGMVEIAKAIWDRVLTGATHNIGSSAGKRLRQLTASVLHSGTAQAGGVNTITLDTGASASNSIYVGALVSIDGGTGAGQSNHVLCYNGATKVATLDDDWVIVPDATSTFTLTGSSAFDAIVGCAQAGGATTITLSTFASTVDDIYNDGIIYLASGTGGGQWRRIVDYVGATKVATVDRAWTGTNPASGTGYMIFADCAKVVDDLTTAAKAQVKAEVDGALDTAGTELSAIPTTTGTLRQKINFLFQYFRNKKTVTATTETLLKEDASTTLGTATVSEVSGTFTKGEMN